jgi:hypothetical protein
MKMLYEYYFHPVKKIRVMVFPNGSVGSNKNRFTIQRIDDDLVRKTMASRRECRNFLINEKGYIREPEVTRTANKSYSGGV